MGERRKERGRNRAVPEWVCGEVGVRKGRETQRTLPENALYRLSNFILLKPSPVEKSKEKDMQRAEKKKNTLYHLSILFNSNHLQLRLHVHVHVHVHLSRDCK
jgi:hypothetical protein